LPRPIDTLEGMQRIDLVIKGIEDEERDYQEKIAALKAELESMEVSIEGIEKEAEGLKDALGEAELRVSQANDRISKNEGKIRSVSGNRELKALNKEINTAGKVIRQAEKDASELRGRLTEQGLLREAREIEMERVRAEMEALEKELSEKREAWQAQADGRKAERQALAAQLPDSMYRIYENIRLKRGGRALVPLKGEACQGCYMHVPPQTFVRLKRGDEDIIRCPHCDRILYVEHAGPTEAS